MVFQVVTRACLGNCKGVSGWSLGHFLVVVRVFWVQTSLKKKLGWYKPPKLQFDCWALLGKTWPSWAKKTDVCSCLTPFVAFSSDFCLFCLMRTSSCTQHGVPFIYVEKACDYAPVLVFDSQGVVTSP